MRVLRLASITLTWLALAAPPLYAQASIVGVVRDASGAVLPGVTVEAASPALIEKIRSVLTDGTGQYRIENLRPGIYSLTFTLQGFNAVRREGIELTGTFTASVNADLRVGAIEETITVTGETPIVDVQNTTRQQVMDRELITALPSSRNPAMLAALLPAVTKGNQDVGGLAGEGVTAGAITVHGNPDVRTTVNGISIHATQGSGSTGAGNIAAYQEMQVDTAGISAEQKEGGVRMNLVPRDGGNTFSGSVYGSVANHAMQSSNFTEDLKDRGLGTPNSLKKWRDVNPSYGGRIIRDRLWFFSTARYNRAVDFSPIFHNLNAGNPHAWTYEPDTSRRGSNDNTWKGANARITWQATAKHKFGVSYDFVHQCECPRNLSARTSPEANVTSWAPVKPITMLFVDWMAPVTNRLLFEASVLKRDSQSFRPDRNIYFTHDPGPVKLNAVLEQSTNLTYRASPSAATSSGNPTFLPRMAMSYITGAHAFKVGFNLGFQSQDQRVYEIDSPMSFRFNNGVPNQLTIRATPYWTFIDQYDHGLFVQDRWTVKRLTLTGGLRYDYFHVSFPGATLMSGEFAPGRNVELPGSKGVRWHDIEPRSGLAIDLFGDGTTAIKVSLNKYLAFFGAPNVGGTTTQAAFTSNMGPAARLVTTTNRSWNDSTFPAGDARRGNFIPDCDLLNPSANGECGAMSNRAFGTLVPGSSYDPDTLKGWNQRPDSNWQFSAGVQREIVSRVSVDVSYFRTWFLNLVVTDDRAVSPSDFDGFSITAPSDARLPGGGGYTVSGLYNLKPAAFGIPADNYITFSNNYGKQIRHWNGVDVTVNARLRSDLTVQGGTSSGRTTTDNCEVVAKLPEILFGAATLGDANTNVWLPESYCRQLSPFLTQVKFLGVYTVPRIALQVTGTFQSLPGPLIAANYVATNAVVAPGLGRTLSGSAANMTVNIVEPGTMFGERMNQVDLRIARRFDVGRTDATLGFDVYNVFNANPVLIQNNAFAAWQQPQKILGPRFVDVVVQLEF